MHREAHSVIAVAGLLVLWVSCGPSQVELQAKKGAEEKSRIEMALKQVEEAAKVPQLTGQDVVIEGEKNLLGYPVDSCCVY